MCENLLHISSRNCPQDWFEAYDYTTSRGAVILNQIAQEHDPFRGIGERTVSVQVTSVVRMSDSSFQVKWIEQHFDHDAPASTEHWTGILTIITKPPTTAEVLGAPIVNRERQLGINPVSSSFGEADAEHAERLRQAQLAQQAHEAKAMFQVSRGGWSEVVPPAQQSDSPSSTNNSSATSTLADDQNQQQHKLDFTRQRDDSGIDSAHGLVNPVSRYELFAGTVIPASLITGINSDLPGLAIAQVAQDLWDLSGSVLLVPQGSRLLGKVDSVVAFGQGRALVVWQRIVMPNGTSIEIDNTPATDTEGYASLEDEVDYHTWRLIKGVALSTLLGLGAQLSVNNSNDDLLTALRESAQDSANQAGQKITQRTLNLQPTITVRPGFPLRLVLSKDLLLQPYRG